MQAGFGVRDCFDEGRIGADDVLQDVFRVPGGADSEDLQLRALVFDLPLELLQDFDRVLDRVALGELIGLRQNRRLCPLSSTALVEVEPPSRPTKPSTTSPGWNVVE